MEESKVCTDTEKMNIQLELEKEATKQLEIKMKIAQLEFETCNAELRKQEILLDMFHLKLNNNRLRSSSLGVVSKLEIDMDQLLDVYYHCYPSHRPYIYWQSIQKFCSSSDILSLRNALRQHDICKYVKWLSIPPCIKNKRSTF